VLTGPRGKIKHVIIMVQENRTPDNLFHGLPGADIANSGVDSHGTVVPLRPVPLANNYGLGHSHDLFLKQYDNGKMDGANLVTVKCNNKNDPSCPPKHPQFMYVDPADVAPYFQIAQTYTFGDAMFQSNQGPSYPSHQFVIAGTSTPGGQHTAQMVSGNPVKPMGPTGCIEGPPGQHVPLIDSKGNIDQKGVFPCFEHATMMDLLTQAGNTWSYYGGKPGGILMAPNSIQHIAEDPSAWVNVKTPPATLLTDIANGTLSDVSWVIPLQEESDHPGHNDGTGPSWVASVVNAVGNSPYWADTVIFVTWDDWGGWYDHVKPTINSSYETGFRVPLLVVSTYAKTGYVSKVRYTFGSFLKFIEVSFNLPTLGFEDVQADEMLDCFDFKSPPRKFTQIQADHDAAYFIRRQQAGISVDIDADDE
jgi:phospholipase C